MKKAALIALAVLLLVSAYGWWRLGKNKEEGQASGMTAEEIFGLNNPPREPELIVDGVAYAKKVGITSLLFMGIDKTASSVGGGQCDTVFLVINNQEDEVQTVLQISRDTMVEIDLLDANGKPFNLTRRQQICLSHSYGPGNEISCENTVRAVSRLLNDIQVDGYVAIPYDAIPIVNDVVDGVEVKIEDDFSSMDPSLVEGESVTLKGEQALHFVRGRMTVADGTNENRMKRQRTYMNAFGEKLKAMIKDNSIIIDRLYQAAEPYMVTDMTLGSISSFAIEGVGYRNGGIVTPPGKVTFREYPNGKTYAEFIVDEEGLLNEILTLFYDAIG
jgi:LCP family protein required for cell wall assembly